MRPVIWCTFKKAATVRGGEKSEAAPAPPYSLEGLIRDERGVRFAPEAED